ncbi:MAG: LPD5 domain-containing protein [Prevotella sp.]|jgi:hypothetical protein|nr:LPD5 domain-containing protein [Prevotella sp.]
MQTAVVSTDNTIQDFGQKIGGAKKDLARQQLDRIKLITNDALMTQPLSKVFPRPDFQKMFRENIITAESCVLLQYLYNSIPTKPRTTYKVRSWATRVMDIVTKMYSVISDKAESGFNTERQRISFERFKYEMQIANWPHDDYNPHPFIIEKMYYNIGQGEYCVFKGNRIKHQGSMQQCVDWVKENAGVKKTASHLQCEVRYYRETGERLICPKGKPHVILRRNFTTREEAYDYIRNHIDDLEKTYNKIRFVPQERRDWNRPRVGCDHRATLDISPEQFSVVFPFRGVEFGNWLNQVDRAASLNEAYDALMDLSLAMGVEPARIALSGKLALAFGARGSGKASAHYEPLKKVINLTKTRGAGALAHEWFHALDNYICAQDGNSLSFASCAMQQNATAPIYRAFRDLRNAIIGTSFYKRSVKCDEFRSKLYWSSTEELVARGFEKYIITKLASLGWHNDYLANIKSFGEYGADEKYPYPSNEEIELLAPYYVAIIRHAFNLECKIDLRKTA